MDYVELQVTSNYSFLRGASHVEELCAQASIFGYEALAIADRNSLAGIARAQLRAKEAGIRLIVGCRLDLRCGASVLIYPTDRPAYARLCRLLSLGKSRAGKGACDLGWADVAAYADGLIGVLLPNMANGVLAENIGCMACFGQHAYLALTLRRRPSDAQRIAALAHMAYEAGIACVATGDVLYHTPARRILQDVVTCIREGCRIDDAGFRRERFADRHLQMPAEMARRFARYPQALANTVRIAKICRFSLDELRYQYPNEVASSGVTAQHELERLTWEGAAAHYKNTVPANVATQLRHELRLIGQLNYAPYFLTVHSIVRFARSKGILCQGRGSAANSAVCYVLGITAIDPVHSNLLFERFISAARAEPPDIDVDFEHERREEVIQWIFETYGRDRAALCATVSRYRSRGAVREVGKVLGLTEDVTAALSSQVWGWSEDGVEDKHAADLNLNLNDRRLRLTLELARELIGFPRHLSQHPGGFVLTQDRLDDLVPIEPAAMDNRQVIEWDKDDIDTLRFMKVDVLGLGMLGCMRRAFDLLAARRPGAPAEMAQIPADDAETFEMIRRADTVGVFQIESRAQMAMLPRMKPACFYDLVIEVAIVRPGPIQGDMVHPYLRRREGLEKAEYPTPALESVLGKTLGVPLFQEQAMKVAIVCAGFTADEADQLRRSMATFKMTGGVSHFRDKLIAGMVANGYGQEFADRTFRQIEGFGSYGFPESHAASFALIAYASSWMKCHHPDVFACALLNAQPMGFYAPAQIVRDAALHGVEIRAVSVNDSDWDCTLEDTAGRYLAIRLGLRMARGFSKADGERLLQRRGIRPYGTIESLHHRTQLSRAALERLAEADAMNCLHLDRRAALWQVRALPDTELPLFAAREEFVEPAVSIVAMKPGREVVEDYRSVGLSLRRHPVSFLRTELAGQGAITAAALENLRDGKRVTVAGIVLVRQKPGSAKGVMFITAEDETGHVNIIVWPKIFEAQRRTILTAGMIACQGRLQREGDVMHVVAQRLTDLSALLRSVGDREQDFPVPHARGDEAKHGGAPDPREGGGVGGRKIRDIYVPDFSAGGISAGGIKVPTRDFR
jgi:error-prone DNA polymerase